MIKMNRSIVAASKMSLDEFVARIQAGYSLPGDDFIWRRDIGYRASDKDMGRKRWFEIHSLLGDSKQIDMFGEC